MRALTFVLLSLSLAAPATAQVAVRGDVVHTMVPGADGTGIIRDGVVVVTDGKIAAIGPAATTSVPDGYEVLSAAVVTPGLVDARGILGISGLFNTDHDQDQLERSAPVQPHLRALDAYNPHDELIAYARSFGVTTAHTGHAPGELVSGQTIIVKLAGNTVDEAVVDPAAAVVATLAQSAQKSEGKSPGTRGKMVAMLRASLIEAREYAAKHAAAGEDEKPPRDLEHEAFAAVLAGEMPLIVTANGAQDIASALRLQREFGFDLWLDSCAEAYVLLDEIREAGVPVLLHPTMIRFVGDARNGSFETASKLAEAGIPFAIQSGFESYVPKTRIVLFEAALAAAHGLGFDGALRSITIDAATILGVADRVGSLEVGKDGDLALYDGDPLEYTTHCTGVVIEGEVVERGAR